MKNCTTLLLAVAASQVFAQPALTTEHVDLGFNYLSGWQLNVIDEDNFVYNDPDCAFLYVGHAAQSTQSSGTQWEFMGAGEGNPVWVLPQAQNFNLVYLGTAAQDTPFGTFDSYFESDSRLMATGRWIKVSLVEVIGPGNFSMYTNGAFGSPKAWISSFQNGVDNTDVFFLPEGGHIHFNFAFTTTGMYDIKLRASGFIGGLNVFSVPLEYHFGVESSIAPGTVRGRIEFSNFVGDLSQQTVEILVRNGGVLKETHHVQVDGNGHFTFATNERGLRSISIKGSHWLRKTIDDININDNGATCYLRYSLVNGDADPDNEVNLVDYGQLSIAFGKSEGDTGWNANADLDGDGEVTLVDVGILYSTFGQAGDD